MARHGDDGGPVVHYTELFIWLKNQIFMIEYFTYAGVDFRGDLDTSLPPGAQWDAIGKESNFEAFYVF